MTTPWQELRGKLKELQADHESLLIYLADLRARAKEGIYTTKVSPRGDEIEIPETHPKIELDCTLAMYKLAEDIIKRSEATQDDGALEIKVTLALPEATPEIT